MNMMPLANLLESAGIGTKGDTVFVNMLPAEADTAVLLRSPLAGTEIDYELQGYFKTEFQVIVRTPAGAYTNGETLMGDVIAVLTITEQAVESMHFKYCRPRTKPVVFPLSKGNLLEFSVMFSCCFVES